MYGYEKITPRVLHHLAEQEVTNDPQDRYAFTFSPAGTTKNIEYMFALHISKFFYSWKRCMQDFEIYPELNKNGNLHYHGSFIMKDRYKWYKVVLPKMKYHGFVLVKPIDSYSAWLEYCKKDLELMQSLIPSTPLPLYKTHFKPFLLDGFLDKIAKEIRGYHEITIEKWFPEIITTKTPDHTFVDSDGNEVDTPSTPEPY